MRTQPKNIFIGIIIFFFIGTLNASNLLIKNPSLSIEVTFTGDGNMLSSIPVNKENPSGISGNLRFKKNDETVIEMSGEEIRVQNNVGEETLTEPASNDLSLNQNEDDEVEVYISSNEGASMFGTFNLTGTFDGPVIDKSAKTVLYIGGNVYEQRYDDAELSLAYSSLGSEGRTVYNEDEDGYTYYNIQDHLGTTRMVVSEEQYVVENIFYHSYGKIGEYITDPESESETYRVRNKFTGKEFDQEGSVNGAGGIDAYYFVARIYDPEVGIFLSTDPAGQYVNAYSYTGGNPIMLVDPNGETAVGAIIGGFIGAYAGGAMANGSFNPGQWDWENPGTYFGMIQGGISGAQLGNSISDAIIARPRHMSGAQIDNTQLGAGEYEMKQQFPADDATPLQNKTRIALKDYVNDKPWRQKYEWGIVSESTPDGGLDYRIWQGTRNTIPQPPSNVNASNYSVAMHTHTIKGAVPSSDILHYTKGSGYYFVEKANDANWARGLSGRGFRGDYMVYNMPDKTLWGYQIAPKGVGIQFWQVNF